MSGAQGAQPPGSTTATTYESVPGGENKTRVKVDSKEDQGAIQVDKLQEKVPDAAGEEALSLALAKMKIRKTWELLALASS